MPSQLIISDESLRTLLSKTNDKKDMLNCTMSRKVSNYIIMNTVEFSCQKLGHSL